MAVPEKEPYKKYIANGSTAEFALTFPCKSESNLIVLLNGEEANAIDWSLVGESVVFATTPKDETLIELKRNTPFERATDFKNHDGSFNANTLNQDFDRAWWKIQELGIADWLLGLKIQKFRDDVNLTALENTLEEAKRIRDETADSVTEVQSNVEQSTILLADTTAQAEAAATSATNANTAKAQAETAATDATTQVGTLKTYVDSAVGAISTDASKQYATLALANADIANIALNKNIFVSEAANGGYWYKTTADATTLTKSPYDPLVQAKEFTDSLATVKSQNIEDRNLDIFTTEGVYYKPLGGGIPTDFASLSYPEKNSGSLEVSSNKLTGANLQIKQKYTVFGNSNIYVRQKIGATDWTTWVLMPRSSDISAVSKLKATGLIWQKATSVSPVGFDATTKTVTIRSNLVASYEPVSSRRIQIYATSANPLTFQITNNFSVVWLDLDLLPSDGNITTDNYATIIKVSHYGDAAALRYSAKPNQVPLMYYDHTSSKIESADGFVQVIHPSSGGDVDIESSDYFEFDKTQNRVNVFLPTSSGELIRVGLQHQITPASQTASVGSNSDLWRLYTAHLSDKVYNISTQIVNDGEWECAIYHTNNTQAEGVTKDFVGGYHGDEVLLSAYFLVNGVKKEQDFLATKVKVRELTLVQKSTIFFQGTNTPLAEHSKVVTFSKDAINVKQLLKTLTEVTVNPFYMCMLPIMRVSDGIQVTDASSRSDDYFVAVDDNSVGGLAKRYSLIDKPLVLKQWGATSGFSATTTIHKMTQLVASNNVYIALNSTGASYNKVYASPSNTNVAHTIEANTVLESDVTYQFDKTT